MKNSYIPHATSSLNDWLSYIEDLHPKSIDLDIIRINQVARKLDLLKPAPFIFTVAGTNGKGTTCRVLEILLLAAGYRVGVYNSPHLLRYTERVRIQGLELSEETHTASFAFIEENRCDTLLTYFEFGTLSALYLFKQAELDIVILEVGLGGRFDATNIVDSDISIITNVALDHTNYLGPDRESIGREKAGIFRSKKPAIVGESNIPRTIINVAKEKGAKLIQLGRDWKWNLQKNSWRFQDSRIILENLPIPQVPIPNAATALAALSISDLNVSEVIIRKYLNTAMLPGRFQIILHSPKVILDVAHNPHAASYLSVKLSQLHSNCIVHALVGMLQNKDIAGTLANLAPKIDRWYLAPLEAPYGASAEQLFLALKNDKAKIYTSLSYAWKEVMKLADRKDIILVFGSFHTVACIIEEIKMEKYYGQ